MEHDNTLSEEERNLQKRARRHSFGYTPFIWVTFPLFCDVCPNMPFIRHRGVALEVDANGVLIPDGICVEPRSDTVVMKWTPAGVNQTC